MKILILAGGTGSINLQKGIYNCLGNLDGLDVKVLTNAYDNGLSTGAVRKVCGGKILGPSDVRKNQTTRLALQNPASPWLKFLDTRFTSSAQHAKQYCYEMIDALEQELRKIKHHATDHMSSVKDAVDYYFQSSLAYNIDYTDFSLANIIYAGFAKGYGNSLRDAAKQMAFLLGIPDNVILNSDESLFLSATTKSGLLVTDEGDIVNWGNTEDPFVSVSFTDCNGKATKPVLCQEAKDAISSADLIILSTGTQWSSLIPTYESVGFKEAIANSSAKVIMLMNQFPDKDSPGQSAAELLTVLVPQYFDRGRLNVIIAEDSHPLMRNVQGAEHLAKIVYTGNLMSEFGDSKFSPLRVFFAIAKTYFAEYLDSDYYMFDYDDTLVARGNSLPVTSSVNVNLLKQCASKNVKVGICTGNSIKAIDLKPETLREHQEITKSVSIDVFADGGINQYVITSTINSITSAIIDSDKSYQFVKCLVNDLQFGRYNCQSSKYIREVLLDNGINPSKIEERGNVMISIKPIEDEYRDIIVNLLTRVFEEDNIDVLVKKSGRTTVEIYRRGLSKKYAVQFVLDNPDITTITYVGDEFKNGNDKIVADMDSNLVKCLPVNSPAKTAFFLTTLSMING